MIIVDTSEPDYYFQELVNRGVVVEKRSIGFCDYIVSVGEYSIGVERKTPEDFVNSIIDNRVFNQTYMLSVVFPKSFIIIEGLIFEALLMRKFPRRAYIGAIVSIGLKTAPHGQRGSISIVIVETRNDTVEFLELIHKKLEEGDLTRLPRLVVRNKKSLDKKAVLVMMLQAVPGIGEKKAVKIAEKYSSIRELVETPFEKLVETIGYTTAMKIKQYLV